MDDDGVVVVDESGQPVMVPNEAYASWLDSTALTTALSLEILSYGLSAMALAPGEPWLTSVSCFSTYAAAQYCSELE